MSCSDLCSIVLDESNRARAFRLTWRSGTGAGNRQRLRVCLSELEGDADAALQIAEQVRLHIVAAMCAPCKYRIVKKSASKACISRSEAQNIAQGLIERWREVVKSRGSRVQKPVEVEQIEKDGDKKMVILVKRELYDLIKQGVKTWEARPAWSLTKQGWRPSRYALLASHGRQLILQSGSCTNDDAYITEVRRYACLHHMMCEIGTYVLPGIDSTMAVRWLKSTYTEEECARGFVAFRIKL